MTQKQLKQLITQGESQMLEFKSSLKLMNEIGETISALANTSGGIILIGVSDEGKILGVDIGKKTMEDLANFIKENTDPAFVVVFKLPPILEDLEKLGLNERQIKAIEDVIKRGSITNKEYTALNQVSRKTATLDLTDLVKRGLFIRTGKGKRDARYELLRKNYAKNYAKDEQEKSKE